VRQVRLVDDVPTAMARGGERCNAGGRCGTMTTTAARCDCAYTKVRRQQLAPGDAGIYQTAGVMRDLVLEAQKDPVVRQHAADAVQGVPPGDAMAEISAVVDWIVPLVDYR